MPQVAARSYCRIMVFVHDHADHHLARHTIQQKKTPIPPVGASRLPYFSKVQGNRSNTIVGPLELRLTTRTLRAERPRRNVPSTSIPFLLMLVHRTQSRSKVGSGWFVGYYTGRYTLCSRVIKTAIHVWCWSHQNRQSMSTLNRREPRVHKLSRSG
ncbi:hypothetical protein BDN67DRAFT_636830 [Paxillus ammoniavirescens]|nr:hypothetical protein BDN67DRAFT_636830 [Paxillus ammoniavirescens]